MLCGLIPFIPISQSHAASPSQYVPFSLGLPWPNPANGSVRVLVDVPNGGQGDLGIYDLRGRRILERVVGAGSHLLEWDGLDNHGRRVASGTYIIRLEGSGPAVMRKVVLLN